MRSRSWAAALLWGLFQCCGAAAQEDPRKTIPRHSEEVRALTQPEQVLEELPAKIDAATQAGNPSEVALLRLAEANACRVLSRLACQVEAGRRAALAGREANDSRLHVRGLVLQASGAIAMRDFVAATPLLAQAERELAAHPHPLLAADVFLAYSSISLALGDLEHAQRYANQGLAALGDTPAAVVRSRLLRNLARAQTLSRELPAAEATLQQALALVPGDSDPKLRAELHLELARLARERNNPTGEQENAKHALALAQRFDNTQITGQAHEILGIAAQDRDDAAAAEAAYALAIEAFRKLRLERDERRVLRRWMRMRMAGTAAPADDPLLRLMELERTLDAEDQAIAAENFEARLAYAQQEFEVGLLKQSVATARQRQQLSTVLLGAGILLIAILAGTMWSQRRYSARLGEALRKGALAERAAVEAEGRLRALTDNIPAAIAKIGSDERYVEVNAYLAQMVKSDARTLIGRTVREVRGEAMYEQFKPYIDAVLRGETVRCSTSSTPFGTLAHYNSVFVPDRALDGSVIGFYALTFDVTELRTAQDELEKLARIDSLTGIANRRHFEERLTATLAHAKRTKRGVAVLAIDVDRFKGVNDTYGHAVGDAVLREFVTRVLSCVRQDDFFARVGGDEFMLLVEEPPAIAGEVIAKKLLHAMDAPFVIGELSLKVTMSIGAAFGDGTQPATALLALADEALYEAKNQGRATFSVKRPASAD